MTNFEQGYAAFLASQPIDANPNDKDTAPYSLKRWADGWKAAQLKRLEKSR